MAKRTSGRLLAALLIFLLCLPFLTVAVPHWGPMPTKRADPAVLTTLSTNKTVGVVATGWYAGWLGAALPPSQVSWTKYTALTFAFA